LLSIRRMLRIVFLAMLALGCGGPKDTSCKPVPCATPCGSVGYKTDAATGCRQSCECNGAATSCPMLSCSGTCGLGNAQDLTTGCPTCNCCFPADCQPGGCHATGNDGCPTCVAC
jgi:hypothetical protein